MYLLSIQSLTYALPDGTLLLNNLHLHIHHDTYCLTGRNGSGKSTLFNLISGQIKPLSGSIILNGSISLMPQLHSLNRNQSIASFLGVEEILSALKRMETGEVREDDLILLEGKWDTENKVLLFLREAGLSHVYPGDSLNRLSGGELSKLAFFHSISSNPDLLLLDEPTNHLDRKSRLVLYELIRNYKGSILFISHDRELLNLCNQTLVLNEKGLHQYSGTYDFYLEQRKVHQQALFQQITHARKAITKARQVKKETIQKQEKRNTDGLRRAVNTGESKLDIDIKRGSGEGTLAKLKESHRNKEIRLKERLEQKEAELTDNSLVDVVLENPLSVKGKIMVEAIDLNSYPDGNPLWQVPLNIRIKAGEKWHIEGSNGSGKTSFLQLIRGEERFFTGSIKRGYNRVFVIDQHLTCLKYKSSLLENLRSYALSDTSEAHLRTVLDYFLFNKDKVNKPVDALSGGERLRAALACLVVAGPVDLLILDEPTNYLDADAAEQLRMALKSFKGTMVIACHDLHFTSDIGITDMMNLDLLLKSEGE